MPTVHFIAMDTHSHTTDLCVKTRANQRGKQWRVATKIPALREALQTVARPRKLTFEEGPLADWLLRNLQDLVEEVVVCDPRKNALVARDGDKDDPVDAGKLCDLYIGGYLRAVHHAETLGRQLAKQTVGFYHERVWQRVRSGHKVLGLLKRWGVIARAADFATVEGRQALLEQMGTSAEAQSARRHVELLWRSYDEAQRAEKEMGRELRRLARNQELIARWQAVPGIGPVRALTLWVYLDTPVRFRHKSALGKYMGIGLVREKSGQKAAWVHVSQACNRPLKNAILGAAESVIQKKLGVFYEQYEQWRAAGLSYKNARRNVARSLAAVLWGMWKSGQAYDPSLVGRACVGAPAGGRTRVAVAV
jgi:transposase